MGGTFKLVGLAEKFLIPLPHIAYACTMIGRAFQLFDHGEYFVKTYITECHLTGDKMNIMLVCWKQHASQR